MLSRVAMLYGVRKVGRGTLCVGDSFGSVSCREAVKFHFTSLHHPSLHLPFHVHVPYHVHVVHLERHWASPQETTS